MVKISQNRVNVACERPLKIDMGNPHQPKRKLVKKKPHKLLLIESCTNRVRRECDVGYPKYSFLPGIVKIPLIWTIAILGHLGST